MLPFLTNQVALFISCGDIGWFYFSGNIAKWGNDGSLYKPGVNTGQALKKLKISKYLIKRYWQWRTGPKVTI